MHCAIYGGRFIHVRGSETTARIRIGGACLFRGRSGSNMTHGIVIDGTVPDGLVDVDERVTYGESVTTPLTLAKNLSQPGDVHAISSTGTTVVRVGAKTVVVNVNGSVTSTLWNPSLTPGRRVTVRNTSTQAGTTTVGTASGTIDGNASIVGAGARTYEAFGTTWQLVGSA